MDVKRVFDHITRNCLQCPMEGIEADGDLMRWTKSFRSDRSVGLVIDVLQCEEEIVETRVTQGSLMSPVLFVIYLSRLFRKVEAEVE